MTELEMLYEILSLAELGQGEMWGDSADEAEKTIEDFKKYIATKE